jgi:hypothetical protein
MNSSSNTEGPNFVPHYREGIAYLGYNNPQNLDWSAPSTGGNNGDDGDGDDNRKNCDKRSMFSDGELKKLMALYNSLLRMRLIIQSLVSLLDIYVNNAYLRAHNFLLDNNTLPIYININRQVYTDLREQLRTAEQFLIYSEETNNLRSQIRLVLSWLVNLFTDIELSFGNPIFNGYVISPIANTPVTGDMNIHAALTITRDLANTLILNIDITMGNLEILFHIF